MYIAHKREDGKEQPLLEHLQNTAQRAATYARVFAKEDLAYICGILHDIGKYSIEFQNRIKNDGKLCDHSTAGAKVLKKINDAVSKLLGYVITGHHSGLLNGGGWGATCNDKSLYGRLKKEIPDYSSYAQEIDINEFPGTIRLARQIANTMPFHEHDRGYCFSFLIRMIFSCLVDADFLDTEEFMKDGTIERGIECSFVNLEEVIIQHTNTFVIDSFIKEKRKQILNQCLEKAKGCPGVYKLTVPTGGGKTISSMAFALRHIKLNPQLRRVIYAIPFTSIIEQNAKVFSDIFGERYILEHHSNYDFNDKDDRDFNLKKLATENWDMPIIVTTNVQFFESIYSNKSSKLRKLHNIANSVIILDEVQMLPAEYLIPCVKALEELVHNYNSTVVLCSATQPEVERFMSEKTNAIEICNDTEELYSSFNKTRIRFIGNKKINGLIEQLQGVNQCLIIVNTKKQAKKLYEELEKTYAEEGVFHLSTYMCPVHRHSVIEEIKQRLKDGRRCIVVSTSLIEAGVDVDFPVVYRAMCGLDSIIQAAGRCNRERKRDCAYVYVFDFEEEEYKVNKSSAYGNYLGQRQSITEIIASKHEDVTTPEAIKEYFDMLFDNMAKSELDKKSIVKRLNQGYDISTPKDFIFDFEDIAHDFKMIDDDTCSVIVGYDDEAIRKIKALEYGQLSKANLRSLQKYTVSLNKYEYNKLKEIKAIKEYGENIGILLSREDYSDKTGIIILNQLGIAEFV
ncbi:MAG: CRISPR-associated helicase Cas3' [Acetivibrionales bacterium]